MVTTIAQLKSKHITELIDLLRSKGFVCGYSKSDNELIISRQYHVLNTACRVVEITTMPPCVHEVKRFLEVQGYAE